MVIGLQVEGFEELQWGDMWPRHIAYGDCEGWCGSGLLVVLTRAFTTEEDLLFDWVSRQDLCHLYGVAHLTDGRDLIVFERQFKSQTPEEAFQEHIEHLRRVFRTKGLSTLVFT